MPFYPKFGCRERRRQALMHRHGRPDLADTHGKCSRIGSHREEQSKEKKASVDADTRAAAPLDGQAEARSLDDFTLVEPHTHLWKQPRLNQFGAGHVHIGPSAGPETRRARPSRWIWIASDRMAAVAAVG